MTQGDVSILMCVENKKNDDESLWLYELPGKFNLILPSKNFHWSKLQKVWK